ncbi:DUF1877 family protein [Nocardia sp. NPDC056064]|uniref:DUF1877 family protein n=1 Tax=Nocardia sp. NPDC056064 TaxID=3345701 RepID=UPI0035E01154
MFDNGRPLPDDNYFAWHPDDVAAAAKALTRFPFDELALFFDPVTMDGAGIYPAIWARDGQDALNYLRHHYVALEQVFRHAAEHGSGLLQHFG